MKNNHFLQAKSVVKAHFLLTKSVARCYCVFMKRYMMTQLVAWKTRSGRKPLILRGVRQTGKTYLLEQFGADH